MGVGSKRLMGVQSLRSAETDFCMDVAIGNLGPPAYSCRLLARCRSVDVGRGDAEALPEIARESPEGVSLQLTLLRAAGAAPVGEPRTGSTSLRKGNRNSLGGKY